MSREVGGLMTAGLMTTCTQPDCTGAVIDGYCDVCGSPAGAVPFTPATASAAPPAPGDAAGLTTLGRESGIPPQPSNGLVQACAQPGCVGMIVDGYCDVCGSPAGAVPFVPAAASAAPPAPADAAGLTTLGRESGDPQQASNGLVQGCAQPGCVGMIVDGYCDVCGSPVGAVLFVPAAASAAPPAPADAAGLTTLGRESGDPQQASNGLVQGCAQPGCVGMIVDGYCDVCGSPVGAVPFVPAAASAAPPAPADAAGLTTLGRESGDPQQTSNGLVQGCAQPGCVGMIVDGYCDVCGSPVGAVPFVPAAASAASAAPADAAGLTTLGRESGDPQQASNGLVQGCAQPGCVGMIVDGYCDVCGSPVGAVPFVPAAASAASPAPADAPDVSTLAAPTRTPARVEEE